MGGIFGYDRWLTTPPEDANWDSWVECVINAIPTSIWTENEAAFDTLFFESKVGDKWLMKLYENGCGNDYDYAANIIVRAFKLYQLDKTWGKPTTNHR